MMKKLSEVPESALSAIQTEHQRALSMLGDRKPIATIPIREVKMKIDRPSQDRSKLESVIVPEIVVYYHSRGGDDGGYYRRNGLSYFLKETNTPFPFGHLYSSSGSVCLGSIFVPSKISLHTPTQPLEALFLHNDHHVAHGGAKVELQKKQIDKALDLLQEAGVLLSHDAKTTFVKDENIIKNDAPWIISSDVVNQLPMDRALYVMDKFFKIIFNNKEEL